MNAYAKAMFELTPIICATSWGYYAVYRNTLPSINADLINKHLRQIDKVYDTVQRIEKRQLK